MIAQMIVSIASAIVLVCLRSSDSTAALSVLALTLYAVAGGGPLMGSEAVLPGGLRQVMTLFAWLATPVAFPVTAVAILYFPAKTALLSRRPWLHALPFAAAAPMIVLGLMSGLYVAGADSLGGLAAWDARHPEAYHKYRIDQVIGRGGMGAVYRARDVRLDRDVAIKVVRSELLGDPEARTRFAARRRSSPSCCTPRLWRSSITARCPTGARFW